MDIVIFEDGKGARGSKAKLIRRGNKRILIEFTKYDFDTDKATVVAEWFKLFIPPYSRNKKSDKHNNKRKNASYHHGETNEFYNDWYQTEEYKLEVKECFTEEYFNKLFN